MRIVRETPDELVIHVSATASRIWATAFILFGGVICALGLKIVLLIASGKEEPNAIYGAAMFLAFGGFLMLPGIIVWFTLQHTEYHFARNHRELVIHRPRGDTIIPFSLIESAEVTTASGHDEPTAYGLRLLLRKEGSQIADSARAITRGGDMGLLFRRIPASIVITPIRASGAEMQAQCTSMAQRINLLLLPDKQQQSNG